jgi:hypothetical protein
VLTTASIAGTTMLLDACRRRQTSRLNGQMPARARRPR